MDIEAAVLEPLEVRVVVDGGSATPLHHNDDTVMHDSESLGRQEWKRQKRHDKRVKKILALRPQRQGHYCCCPICGCSAGYFNK
jgi:hypothetical protein